MVNHRESKKTTNVYKESACNLINFQRYALEYALRTVDPSVIYVLGCALRTAVRFCLWLCAGKYALTQDRKPGEATGKASRRPEGCPRGQIDTLGYAQGYALPKGQPGVEI